MSSKLVNDTLIPSEEGRAFEVKSGQRLRLIAVEGKQVGDLTAFNFNDQREQFSVIFTTTMSGLSVRNVRKLYSGPPFFNEMLSIENDAHGVHWLGGRCHRILYAAMGAPEHRNCHDNILEALAHFGLTEHDVTLDTLNVFMNVVYTPNGSATPGA